MSDYNITFTCDGSLIIRADSEDDAERQAVDLLECLDFMDAAGSSVEGCTVRVTSRFVNDFDDDRTEPVYRGAKAVEFCA